MIVFTILGVLVYWWVMGCIGYFGAMFYDAHRGLTSLSDDIHRNVDEIRVAIDYLLITPKGQA